MSSFFLRPRGPYRDKKRRKPGNETKGQSKGQGEVGKRVNAKELNEEIASDSEAENEVVSKRPRYAFGRESDSEGEEHETAPEKRLRLAKEYLAKLETVDHEDREVDEEHRDAIAHRLREDVLEQSGRLQRKVADQYSTPDVGSIRFLKGHQLPVTCVAMTPDSRYIYSGAKDCTIIKWDFESGKKEVIFSGHRRGIVGVVGHTGHILALAVSSDGEFLASGGQDRVVHVWGVKTNLHRHTFRGHKDSVTGLAFQFGTHELFTASLDRTVKIWNLDEMSYVETLFGHQDGVSSIDCLHRERPVTAGTSDRSLRMWKVLEESQLVFHGHKASIDCVRLINEEHMVAGSQDGGVSLWNILKKKPLHTRPHHQQDHEQVVIEEGPKTKEHWVSSVAAYPNTDMVASGSNDGKVCVWKCGENMRSMELLFSIPLRGFINDLRFSPGGDYLVAAVGQEHRFGRWWKERGGRNRVAIIPMNRV